MTWFSETFYWRPCKDEYDASIHLYIDDGWRIRLDLDDCKASPNYYDCECDNCGCDDTALAELSIEELIELRDAMNKAIDYYYEEKRKRDG